MRAAPGGPRPAGGFPRDRYGSTPPFAARSFCWNTHALFNASASPPLARASPPSPPVASPLVAVVSPPSASASDSPPPPGFDHWHRQGCIASAGGPLSSPVSERAEALPLPFCTLPVSALPP